MINQHYINGEWTDSTEPNSIYTNTNPAKNEEISKYQNADTETVEKAVESAKNAFPTWKNLSYIDRAEYLWDIHTKLRENIDKFGKIVSKDCGKEISEGRADVVEAAHMVEWAAGNARHPHGDVIPSEISEKDSYMRRKPRGVTGCITPWNFPIAIPFWHIAVTLVEGNTVVWKPSEETTMCGQVVGEIIDDVGLPDGVFNLVQGGGDVGDSIVSDSRVKTILFTGSAEVGQKIQNKVSDYPEKQVACEMGGKNGIVVTENASLDLAVKSAVLSSFKTTGQRCVSTERLIIHESIYEQFKSDFISIAESIQVGDPLNEDTFMGPLINDQQVQKFKDYNQIAREEGANVLVDREDIELPSELNNDGNWVGPFVYEIDYNSNYRCLQEEVFGPHVALIKYEGSIEKGIDIHNDTKYGLTGAIMSEDRREINKFRDEAEVGLAYANIPCIGAEVQLPFGGIKKSGNGYPSAREIIEVVTDRTAWTVNNGENIELSQDLSSEINTDD